MCGIAGMVGSTDVVEPLLNALSVLEYRGYDSAGIALQTHQGLVRRRCSGKIASLRALVHSQPIEGNTGIAHTRWATHGRPSDTNAHPHGTPGIMLAHNGIIENHSALEREFSLEPHSETDSEIVALLLSQELQRGLGPAEAMGSVYPRLHGAFALAILFADDPSAIWVVASGSPLAIGTISTGIFVASDPAAFDSLTSGARFLEPGDWGRIDATGAEIFDTYGERANRKMVSLAPTRAVASRGPYRHFMAKEISEQPEAISHTLSHYIDLRNLRCNLNEYGTFFANARRLHIVGCGTAFHAGMVARDWFETFTQLPCEVEIASEYRYRPRTTEPDTAVIALSQSGETADTLGALARAQERGLSTAALVNVENSALARMADVVMPTRAGPEIGVASTKAFTSQLAATLCLALIGGAARGCLPENELKASISECVQLPERMSRALALEPRLLRFARHVSRKPAVFFLGRGQALSLACEGALKLTELSYIPAIGIGAGEWKHGPIAVIEEGTIVIVLAPPGLTQVKTAANIAEVQARGASVFLITDEPGSKLVDLPPESILTIESGPFWLTPLTYALPLQQIAYHTALFLGTDVDQPRNLAKSVTVE